MHDTYIHTHTEAYTETDTQRHTDTQIHTHIKTHKRQTHTDTYIDTHTHTYTHMFRWKSYRYPYIPPKDWDVGDLQLGAPFHALVWLLPSQTLPLRKPAKSQILPGTAQDHAYRLYKTW